MSRMTYASLWKDQFALKNFLLRHKEASCFAMSQWGNSVLPLALFRTALFIYCLAIQIYAPLYYELKEKFLIFATYWAYLLLVFGLFISSVNTWIYYFRQKHIEESRFEDIGYHVKLQWLVSNCYTSMAFAATIFFWALFFNGNIEFANFNTHAVNLIIVLLEFVISRAPIRLLHFYQPTLVMLAYAIFTVVYHAAGGTDNKGNPYIYKTIDYDNNRPAALAMIFATALVGIPIIHFVVFVLYTVRVTIWRCACSSRIQDVPDNPDAMLMADKNRIV